MNRLKYICIVVLLLLSFSAGANQQISISQQKTIEKSLRTKYSDVHYHPEAGGWYLLFSEKGVTTFYSMGDNLGNVVVSDAIDYKLHEGYISLYIADKTKKRIHDEWVESMKSYNSAYQMIISFPIQRATKKQSYPNNIEQALKNNHSLPLHPLLRLLLE